jgi:anti-sigma factor RsiW
MDIKEQIMSVNGERAAPRSQRPDERLTRRTAWDQDAADHIAAGRSASAAFIQRLDGPVDDLLVPLRTRWRT